MGDVFKAMNRSMRERGESPPPAAPEAAPAPPVTDPEAPALPIAEVEAAAMKPEEKSAPATLPAVSQRPQQPQPARAPVAAAIERAAAPAATAAPTQVNPATPAPSKSQAALNGYSPEVVVHHDRGSVITEQYRAIRTQILARARNRRLQLHVITSSAPQEGKSVTTVNLGMAFCELRNQRTLLVEGDLRRPAFHKYFRRKPQPGLLHYLRGQTDDIDSIIHPSVHDNLQVIPAGDREFTSSTELLSSPRMAQLLDRLRDRYEHIFIDTPPVITVTDACILGALADETLLVVRLNHTPTEVVDRAKRLLRAANCDVAGVILTHMKFHIPNYLYRYV